MVISFQILSAKGRSAFTERVSLGKQLDSVAVVDETVAQRIGRPRAAEVLVPVFDRELRGEDRGTKDVVSKGAKQPTRIAHAIRSAMAFPLAVVLAAKFPTHIEILASVLQNRQCLFGPFVAHNSGIGGFMQFLLIVMAALMLAGCGDGGGANNAVSTSDGDLVNLVQPTNPEQTDYTKVRCGDLESCSRTCDMIHPISTDQEIGDLVCGPLPTLADDAVCDSMIRLHREQYEPQNYACKNIAAIPMLEREEIESVACAESGSCQLTCLSRYRPRETKDILREFGTSGAALRALFESNLVREQLEACADAPSRFVLNLRLM
ncbi:MAG: hypothetical protein NDI61_13565 [Bdellovibrionaceae bacterium]|nr:hypothetical protein [Pseudobdellovibrionaceae bacterium]